MLVKLPAIWSVKLLQEFGYAGRNGRHTVLHGFVLQPPLCVKSQMGSRQSHLFRNHKTAHAAEDRPNMCKPSKPTEFSGGRAQQTNHLGIKS